MPRSRSSSSSRSTSSSRPAASHQQTRGATTAAQPPAVAPQPMTPAMAQPQQPSLFANMASTAAGVAVGSAVGHTIGAGISGLFGGGSRHEVAPQEQTQQQYQQTPVNACEPDQKAFMRCLDANSNDVGACQFYLDMLKQCQNAARTSFN